MLSAPRVLPGRTGLPPSTFGFAPSVRRTYSFLSWWNRVGTSICLYIGEPVHVFRLRTKFCSVEDYQTHNGLKNFVLEVFSHQRPSVSCLHPSHTAFTLLRVSIVVWSDHGFKPRSLFRSVFQVSTVDFDGSLSFGTALHVGVLTLLDIQPHSIRNRSVAFRVC